VLQATPKPCPDRAPVGFRLQCAYRYDREN